VHLRPFVVAAAALLSLAGLPATAAPYLPATDATVLERLPERAADPRTRELRQLRRELAARPDDLELALRVARRYYEALAAEGDPRYLGYAQAALRPWWTQPQPPTEVRLLRAILGQFNHGFDAARADLLVITQDNPGHAEAWAWLAAIAMVQARYPEARAACLQLAPLTTPLVAAACSAAVDAHTGRAAQAVASLRAALASAPEAEPAERLWALTRLAETEERRGQYPAAEAAFREALALGLTDGYLLCAYADFLLDRGRPAEVLTLLRGKERSDLLLLRLALAAQAANAPERARWAADLTARFDAARLRGDSAHEKEEARFALVLRGEAARALQLAQSNYAVQREPADARMLLEAALAAKQPAAAAPALQWLTDSGIESQVLRDLAARLRAAS
jgi:hypothetical protein